MHDDIIGESPEIRRLRDLVINLSEEGLPLLIIGEPGAGKTLLASHIHARSHFNRVRRDILNISFLSDRDQRVLLFGGGPPALTTTRRSVLENPTTVIIKSIDKACQYYQDRLARGLKHSSVLRPGIEEEYQIECRLIFTLAEPLPALTKCGGISRELHQYLEGCKRITIPPLRRRREDIPSLVKYFCDFYRNKFGIINNCPTFDYDRLKEHRWSDNVRELKAFVRGQFILNFELEANNTEKIELMKMLNMLEEGSAYSLPKWLNKLEHTVITRAMADIGSPKARLAHLLGMTERNLRRKSK